MKDILQKLLANEVLNEETKESIVNAASKYFEEARVEQEKAVRAELAERYERDKKAMHVAMEQFLTQQIREHVAEFKQGVEEVDTLKKQYVDKITTVKEQAQKYVAARLGAAEKVVEGVLKKELKELHEDEKRNRRAYLNAITEAKAKNEAAYEAFREKGAQVLEHIVNVQVQKKLDVLQEDIRAARKHEFGREMYEAMATTFRRQFFNSSAEFRKLATELKEAREDLNKTKKVATQKIKEAQEKAQAADITRKRIEESVVRERTIAAMLRPFGGQAREKMKTLLEATRTQDLKATYKKFGPEIMNESRKVPTPKKTKIDEASIAIKTGGSEPIVEDKATSEEDDEIAEIVSLAGLGNR